MMMKAQWHAHVGTCMLSINGLTFKDNLMLTATT